MDKFIESIDKQIEFNQGKNIFLDKPEMFRFINETINAISNINEINSDSEKFLVDYAADKAIEEFCRVNQYYSFDTKSKIELRNIYTCLFADIRTGMISTENISKNHYKRLKDWIKNSNSFAEKIYLNAGSKVEPVVCSEYSPGLQIEILQIETTQLKEPVLDIGCGKQGNLVNYLCENGIDTYGIDRFSFTSNNLFNFDWLEYDYGIEKWGAIISNLGFSNHFKHHNLREDGNYIGYAKKYMEILKSLKIGGAFYYAPDLPFIEQYLDSRQFRIDKKEIGEYDFKTTKITRLK
ncbi:hypothetical protein QUH73_09030 [Labilibaculum sp. K2S]|uniref:hypothetical protein n=1 Tax=Labilibaculum sp. K2S TaxID=3056386 RepID=UPI0025A4A0A1|nr:hypothetical protein [Labilibaculum sp. K2S]MDM8159956.1 hypothetical protein [Labilibaculum sp. K2S]